MAAPETPQPFVVPEGATSMAESEALLDDAVVAVADVSAVEVSGPAAVSCLQGLLTPDIEGSGEAGVSYGAALTPKGMIIADMWIVRREGRVWLTVPANGTADLLEVFAKYLPPRLATPADRSDELAVLRLAGPGALRVASRAGFEIPDPGTSSIAIARGAECLVMRPTEPTYFDVQIQTARSHLAEITDDLAAAGALAASPPVLEISRILAGWPRLGAEIDDKTLPQEVRYDELNGVSYTKGCYTGQETVARLHFRGQANRGLHGLVWEDHPDLGDGAILQDAKPVGRVTSVAWLPPLEQYLGLGMIHRRADTERALVAGNAAAGVVRLPFRLDG